MLKSRTDQPAENIGKGRLQEKKAWIYSAFSTIFDIEFFDR